MDAERDPAAASPEGVVIKVRKNGPYKVTGPVTVIDADGNEFELPEGDGIVLCRCGGSKTKPFCDKTHSKIGFEAAERAVREASERAVSEAAERAVREAG
jgi:CDGSH iron-sulfur domain-containing protein 3